MGHCMSVNKSNEQDPKQVYEKKTPAQEKTLVIDDTNDGAHDGMFDGIKNSELWINTKPFVAPITKGRVIKVYDGDTITVAAKLPKTLESPLYRFSVRLNGIDTPELKTKNEVEKRVALQARDALSAKILYRDVELRNVQTEKYGRLLAEIWLGNECLNKWMITHRFAVKYDGGTKVSPDNWEDYLRDIN